MAPQEIQQRQNNDLEIESEEVPDPTVITVQPKGSYYGTRPDSDDGSHGPRHGEPQIVDGRSLDEPAPSTPQAEPRSRLARITGISSRNQWFSYVRTKEFWLVLLLGQILSLCITGTNTFSSLLSQRKNTSIPAFQSLFNYVLLNLIFTMYTWYRYGLEKWFKLILKDGWRYFIFAFCDVEGNYFTVLAYRYTTILHAQLINFWAIVVVVIISFVVLKRRYQITQYAGILVCIGGMGILFGSDKITGANPDPALDELKGDLFALVGATFYGLGNIVEEFAVSKRPLYEVIGQLAFWAMFIIGVQAAIFDRQSFRDATWDSETGGYLTGYTLILSLFYVLAPLMFRLASAAFFNISLLTANFWGAIIGIHVFQIPVHYLYPIAFVLIVLGLVVYFVTEGVQGEAQKPWLGERQERGVDGVGTARHRIQAAEARSGGGIREGTGPGAV